MGSKLNDSDDAGKVYLQIRSLLRQLSQHVGIDLPSGKVSLKIQDAHVVAIVIRSRVSIELGAKDRFGAIQRLGGELGTLAQATFPGFEMPSFGEYKIVLKDDRVHHIERRDRARAC
jgi:hypothetical protein